ncbi:MAG: hypothetical protein ACOCZA_08695 [Spirochaetota bacterium]
MKLFLILMLGLGLSGCGDRQVERIEVMTDLPAEQESVRLEERPGVAPEREGRLLHTDAGLRSPRYTFRYAKQFSAPETELALRLEYRSTTELQLGLDFEEADSLIAELPNSSGRQSVLVVPLGTELPHTFQIDAVGKADEAAENGSTADLLQLERIALQQLLPPEETVDGFEFSVPLPAAESPLYQYRYRIDYAYHRELLPAAASGSKEDGSSDEASDEVVPLRMSSGGRSSAFRLFAKEGEHSIYFYSKDLAFQPSDLRVETDLPGFRITQVSSQPVGLFAEDTPVPIPADMGTILRYDPQAWRRSDWELFSWNLFPSILMFDFRDYDIQAAFLKRLAFFVEKKGSTGRLLPNSVIDPLHGWNAHNYRARDLAAFFQKAESENFPLNPEEELLRRILIDRGIIHREDGEFLPGEGGFLSLSRESSDRLRYLFVTHEGYHGLYFASQEYRRAVHSVWMQLSKAEKQFWKLFLDWKSYNVEDEYLVENEFQAYLMQQHRSYVDTYFKDYIIPRFVSLYPEYEQKAAAFLQHYPEHFSRSAELIERAAQSLVGISAGDLVCIRESE